MNLTDKIKNMFQRREHHKVETVIIKERQCPHCTTRGLFVFNSLSDIKNNSGNVNEKNK
jgi:hypothetical protein